MKSVLSFLVLFLMFSKVAIPVKDPFVPIPAQKLLLDVYGVDLATEKKIRACCKAEFLEHLALQQQLNRVQTSSSEKILKRKKALDELILNKINKLGKFRLSKLSTVYYPAEHTTYTTVDIVPASDGYRIPNGVHAGSHRKSVELPKQGKLKELFNIWENYFDRNIQLIKNDKMDTLKRSCPVIHCLWGFDKNELVSDLPKLKEGASRYKRQLMDIIRYSDNELSRGEAVLILGHLEDYKELATFLMEFVDDVSSAVRNSSMRVLGAILAQHDIPKMDIRPILKALNYPYVTDRNKAAYVVFNCLLKDDSLHALIIKESGDTLINLLRLKQPNNHDLAYNILRVISKKNYSDRDYQSWKQWIRLKRDPL